MSVPAYPPGSRSAEDDEAHDGHHDEARWHGVRQDAATGEIIQLGAPGYGFEGE
jgi:hypothetical protein